MLRVSLHLRREDTPRADVGHTSVGSYICFTVGTADIYVPGDDSVAVVNARAWAKALTDAADQIVAKLEAETALPQAQEVG